MKSENLKITALSRRSFVIGLASVPWLTACSNDRTLLEPVFTKIETDIDGRIGIAALDMASGRMLTHRGDERFAMCSTIKWILAALVLQRVDQGEESLERTIHYSEDDLQTYSPITKPAISKGKLSLEMFCLAAASHSDNTAANILITALGGPSSVTQALRKLGDETTRLDRFELALNENKPGDPRDTTTPTAMLSLMQRFLFEDLLIEDSRNLLTQWMLSNNTGRDRLRAGIPAEWAVGNRSGTSSNNANNDVAFAIAPDDAKPTKGPIMIVSFTNAPNPSSAEANAVHADVAREVMQAFTT